MFKEEARWIKSELDKLSMKGKKVANLGSSTLIFRKFIQPHIYKYVLQPLELAGASITNVDLKVEKGVDIAADITSNDFSQKISFSYDLILCNNMLEHVEDISKVIDNILSIASPNSFILVTVPRRYPLHFDPIDNGFRPRPHELVDYFVHKTPFQVIKSEVILIKDISYYPIKKSSFPFWGYRMRLKYWFKLYFQVTAVLIQKIN
jgi:SAM-dependent methyltransferase